MYLWEINRAELNFMILKYFNINVWARNTLDKLNAAPASSFAAIMHAGRSDFMTFAIQWELVFALGSR